VIGVGAAAALSCCTCLFVPKPSHEVNCLGEEHRAVVLYCLSPLEKDILSDGTRQALTDSLLKGWMPSRLASIS
jgi:hypothetical protein